MYITAAFLRRTLRRRSREKHLFQDFNLVPTKNHSPVITIGDINHSQVCGIGFPTLQSDGLRQLQHQNPRLLEKTIDRRLVKYWRGFLCTSNVWSDWSSHRMKLEVSHFSLFSKRIESRFNILQPLSTYVTIPSQALPTVLQHHFINHLGAASKTGRPKKKVRHR